MRTSLFLFAMLVIAAPALAQPSVGVKAGLNVADLFFDYEDESDELDTEPRLGFVGGVTADVPFSPMFGVRVEALYAQKGFEVTTLLSDANNPDGVEGTLTVQLDYLDVPVLLNVMIPMQNGLEIGVQAGAVPAFLLRDGIGCSGFDTEDGRLCDEIEANEEEELGFKSFDLGAAAGLTVGAGPFAVDLRYTYGLSNLREEQEDFGQDDPTVRSGVFSVTGVYRFGR